MFKEKIIIEMKEVFKEIPFGIEHSGLDEATGEKDYVMTWQHTQKFQFAKLTKNTTSS